MAQISRRRPENVPGAFYVDDTCIDCDTCRWIAPETFRERGGQAAVYRQPEAPRGSLRAWQALVACPTASIGCRDDPGDARRAADSFPIRITKDVFYCGYASEKSFGAASYFIQRPAGNVLIDSPRFAEPLARRLERRGGVRWLFLTHRDDVADHAAFRARFHCDRILHAEDVTAGTQEVEVQFSGNSPLELAPDLLILPTPGHTEGHSVLLYKEFLFTGDHLAYDPESDRLIAFRGACWYSWEELARSMQRLLGYPFEWVLPGHGRRFHAAPDAMRRKLLDCVAGL